MEALDGTHRPFGEWMEWETCKLSQPDYYNSAIATKSEESIKSRIKLSKIGRIFKDEQHYLNVQPNSFTRFNPNQIVMQPNEYSETKPPVPTFPVEDLRGTLPEARIHDDIDHAAVSATMIDSLSTLQVGMMSDNPIWRDLFVLTGTLRTFNGEERIVSIWRELFELRSPYNFEFLHGSSKVVRLGVSYAWIQAKFTFKIRGPPECICSGYIGLVPTSEYEWKIWLVTTMLEQLEGFPGPDRLATSSAGKYQDELDNVTGSNSTMATDPAPIIYDCIVVGAGFSGLCVAGRMKAMGMRCLVLESNERVGDNWLNRYETVKYHTSKYFSDFPLEPLFTDDYPYYLKGKDLAHGFQKYVDKHHLNVWLSCSLESASLDPTTNTWKLTVNRLGNGMAIKTSHVVLATGIGNSVPLYPKMDNQGSFEGISLHSAHYRTAKGWKGKKGVVIGTANTAHDVASDMLDAGLTSVTMVQRGRTPVFPIEHYQKWSNSIYHANGDIETSDRELLSIPLAITRKKSLISSKVLIDQDYERFDALERRGFRVERYVDLWKCMSERNGGHYQDVGCSAKIAQGLIKIKSDAKLTGYTKTGLCFSDGSKLEADVIVFSTGYDNNIRKEASRIFGTDIGNQLEDLWGIDEEGELRGVFKPTSVPGLWFHGGGVSHARFFSRFLALQIKASTLGYPLDVYKK